MSTYADKPLPHRYHVALIYPSSNTTKKGWGDNTTKRSANSQGGGGGVVTALLAALAACMPQQSQAEGIIAGVCDSMADRRSSGLSWHVVVLMMLLCGLLSFLAGIILGKRRAPLVTATATTQTLAALPIATAVKASQAQTTYKFKWQSPRFVPLPADSHG